jgi:hypothetical protein
MSQPTNTFTIDIAALSGRTKDYILAVCNGSDLTPEEAVKRILDASAGVSPAQTAQTTTLIGAGA